MSSLRGCLVGCGFFAQFQIEAWKRMDPGVVITAVCDLDAPRAQSFAAQWGIGAVYADYETMLDLEKPDFVDIVTRPEQHLAMCQAASARGIHAFCQKPFAPTMEEAQRITAAFAAGPARLMVNENWRWQAWYREIRRLLDAGAIGEPFAFRWVHRANDGLQERPYPNQPYFVDYPRFLIYETLVHYLDAARYLFGEPEVAACERWRINPAIAGEDAALITLRFPGRLRGVIDGNRCAGPDEEGPAMGSLRIDGTGGTLWMRGSGHLELESRGGARRQHDWQPPDVGYRGDSCFGTQQHFVECLRTGSEFETSGTSYLATMHLVEECYRLGGNI